MIRKNVQFQKYKNTLFAFSKMVKNKFLHQKKVQKLHFWYSFKLFSGTKMCFLPFLKMQIMFICTFEIALFSNFRALRSHKNVFLLQKMPWLNFKFGMWRNKVSYYTHNNMQGQAQWVHFSKLHMYLHVWVWHML